MRFKAGKFAGRKRRNGMGEATVKRKLMLLLPGSSTPPSDSLFSNPLEWYETIAFVKCGTGHKGDLLRTETEDS